ncbi:hypothetical protein NEAUS03_2163 [Nematocida ausubeli]|nr:hypothetical protein NEAUS03_2163 [Nematocida ausubeli]
MLKRVLEDITNINHTNIRVTIKKEEKPIRREILKPYIEYVDTYYSHLNRVLATIKEINKKYEEAKEIKLHEEVQKAETQKTLTKNKKISSIFAVSPEVSQNMANHFNGSTISPFTKDTALQNASILEGSIQDLLKANSIRMREEGEENIKRKITEKEQEENPVVKKTKENQEAEQEDTPVVERTNETISATKSAKTADTSSDEIDLEIVSQEEQNEIQVGAGSKSKITMQMRQTLLEWMYDVKVDYKLNSTIYQTAVRIVDKYFLLSGPSKEKYQLIGAVSLFIANKLVACKSRSLKAYVDVCDGAYTQDEFLSCERDILMRLAGFLNFLLPLHIIKEDRQLVGNSLCEYASEAVLLDASYACIRPLEISQFIESNVSMALEGSTPSRIFTDLLKKSPVLLAQQIKQVRELVAQL